MGKEDQESKEKPAANGQQLKPETLSIHSFIHLTDIKCLLCTGS